MANTIKGSVQTPVGAVTVDLALNSNYVPTEKQSSVVVAVRFKFINGTWTPVDTEAKIDSNAGQLLA